MDNHTQSRAIESSAEATVTYSATGTFSSFGNIKSDVVTYFVSQTGKQVTVSFGDIRSPILQRVGAYITSDFTLPLVAVGGTGACVVGQTQYASYNRSNEFARVFMLNPGNILVNYTADRDGTLFVTAFSISYVAK